MFVPPILFPLCWFSNAPFKHFHAIKVKKIKTQNQWDLFFLEMASDNLAKYFVDDTLSTQSLVQALIAVLAQKHMQELKGVSTDFYIFFHVDMALIYTWKKRHFA